MRNTLAESSSEVWIKYLGFDDLLLRTLVTIAVTEECKIKRISGYLFFLFNRFLSPETKDHVLNFLSLSGICGFTQQDP